MTRRGLIIASIVGLAFAAAEAGLLPLTLSRTVNTQALSLLVLALATISSGIAGRVILGRRSVHRYFRLGVPLLAAFAGLAFESAVSNWLIAEWVLLGPAPLTLRPAVIIALVIGGVLYLLAATVYGFAGTRQGFPVEVRIRLLVLLLLSVIPFISVLGFIGILIVSIVWKPSLKAEAPATPATPEPPAASA